MMSRKGCMVSANSFRRTFEEVRQIVAAISHFHPLINGDLKERPGPSMPGRIAILVCLACVLSPSGAHAQNAAEDPKRTPDSFPGETTEDYNKRLEQLRRALAGTGEAGLSEYRIGTNDLLEVNVFEAPELNRSLRVSSSGEITMPLIGTVQAAGLTAQDVEYALEERLRKYLKDPHVGVFVSAVESHPISVVGAVKKPGVFQVRGPKTLLEMISLAEGLADDAGDEVLVMRGAGLRHSTDAVNDSNGQTPARQPAGGEAQTVDASEKTGAAGDEETLHVDMRKLLETGDPRYNVPVYPGDIVKVTRAGIVYVVGEVKKPGGFVLKSHEQMSVLKAIALAEGLGSTAAKGRTRIIRTNQQTGEHQEIPINLGKILDGKAPDEPLVASDIVFVPNSTAKAVLYRGTEAAITTASGVVIFHGP